MTTIVCDRCGKSLTTATMRTAHIGIYRKAAAVTTPHPLIQGPITQAFYPTANYTPCQEYAFEFCAECDEAMQLEFKGKMPLLVAK